MAKFVRTRSGDLTPLEHSRKITKEYLRLGKTAAMKGQPDSGKPFIMRDEFQEKEGDTRRFHFIPQNKTAGIKGQDATILGNEETIDEYYMDLRVDQMAKPFASKGKITKLNTIFDIRDEFTSQIRNWFALADDQWMIDAATGLLTNGFDYVSNGDLNTTVYQNGAGRMLLARPGAAEIVDFDDYSKTTNTLLSTAGPTGLDMDATCKMNAKVLDEIKVMVSDGENKYNIAPVKMQNGMEMYVLLIDSRVRRDLRQDSDFNQHMLSIVEAGIGEDPIASGAMGVWDNIIIKEINGNMNLYRYEDPNTPGEYFTRNLLLGANAVGVGWAQHIDYTEELIDHERQLSVSADEIRGQRKITFDGVDMGVAQIVTASN